jgi:hypothetical protein
VSRDRLDSSPVIPYVIKACICQDLTGYRPRQEKLGCGHDELVSRVSPEDLDPGTNNQSGPACATLFPARLGGIPIPGGSSSGNLQIYAALGIDNHPGQVSLQVQAPWMGMDGTNSESSVATTDPILSPVKRHD